MPFYLREVEVSFMDPHKKADGVSAAGPSESGKNYFQNISPLAGGGKEVKASVMSVSGFTG